MVCRPLPGGGFMCGPRGPRKRCSAPGCANEATRLCDFELSGKPAEQQALPGVKVSTIAKTCDRPICEGHAARVAPNRDYCPPHKRYAKELEDRADFEDHLKER